MCVLTYIISNWYIFENIKSLALKMSSLHCTKHLSLRKLIKKLEGIFTIKETRTVFVDAEFGNNTTGQLNNPARPFKSISSAINSIIIKDNIRNPAWQVLIAPGTYQEIPTVPNGINLVGSGTNTVLSQLIVNGASEISNLQLVGPNLPIINVNFTGSDINGLIRFSDITIDVVTREVNVHGKQVLINLDQSSGVNGAVEFVNLLVTANMESVTSSEAINIGVLSNSVVSTFINPQFDIKVSFEPKTSLIQNTDNRVTILGGSSNILINRQAPQQNVIIFDVPGGFVIVQNHTTSVLEAIISEIVKGVEKGTKLKFPYVIQRQLNETGNVIYANATNSGLIKISDTSLDFGSVPTFTRVLAHVEDMTSRVSLLNVKTFSTFVFPITGVTQNISYLAVSEQANIVANGGLYANIVTVNKDTVGGRDLYPAQDDDFTILVTDDPVNVGLADPAIASQSVIYKGKIINVKNISSENIQVIGQNPGVIFDGDQTLAPLEFRKFQNDGVKWYVV